MVKVQGQVGACGVMSLGLNGVSFVRFYDPEALVGVLGHLLVSTSELQHP